MVLIILVPVLKTEKISDFPFHISVRFFLWLPLQIFTVILSTSNSSILKSGFDILELNKK